MTENDPQEELKIARLPDVLPVLPLENAFVFPKMVFPLEVSGKPSTTLIDEAMAGDRLIGLALLKEKPEEKAPPRKEDFHTIGTSVVVLRMAKTADNKSPLLPQEFGVMAKSIAEAGVLADLIASVINATIEEKQKILDILDVKERLREVTRLVNHQAGILARGR